MKIAILPEFRDLIPPLAECEREQLEANLVAEVGARDPLVVWKTADGELILLDGHNRYEICERLGLPYGVQEMRFESNEAAADWIDANQLGKRNLTPEGFQLAIGRRYQRAKKKAGGDGSNQHKEQCGQNDHIARPKRTAEKIAKEHGVSERTVRRAGKLVEEIESNPDLKQRVAGGETIKQARAEVARMKAEQKAAERAAKKAPEPEPEPEPEPTAKDGMGHHVGEQVSPIFQAAEEDYRAISKTINQLSQQLEAVFPLEHGARLERQSLQQLVAELKRFVKFSRPYTECFKCQRKLQKGCNLCQGTGWLTRNEFGRSRTNGGEAWLNSR